MAILSPLSMGLIMVAMGGCATVQGIFYPFGSAAGDTFSSRSDDGSSPVIPLLSPFPFFGRTYQQIYVNHNGHLTFNQSLPTFTPPHFPETSNRDIIAPFWTDIDNSQKGNISYQQYTTGEVLLNATQDINSYFPSVTFNATWVFVATWDRVAYYSNTGTETTFQVVLISDSNLSFVLMNYAGIASTSHKVQIGYDTISSTHYGSLRTCYPNNTIDIVNLNTSSNINVPGRWAFATTLQLGSFNCTSPTGSSASQPVSGQPEDTQLDHAVGLQLKVSSVEALNETEIEEQILKPLGDLLRKNGVDVSGIRLRRFYEAGP